MNGIIIIDKPQGMTSHDVVSFLRRKTGVKRIGHTGTLDPMATGVLPLFIGKATRLIEYAGAPGSQEAKLYRCEIRFGLETDTLDIWGKVIAESGILPGKDEVEHVLKGFKGVGRQRPPMYSAVKVGGRKLYEYARKGVSVDEGLVKERDIYIKHIIVNHIDMEDAKAEFDVLCSKGVYIRTLCADAGRLLGCGAVMSGLRRLKSDGFSIEDAVPLDDLRDESVPVPKLLPVDTPLGWMKRVDMSEEGALSFARGQKTVAEGHVLNGETIGEIVCVYGPKGFIGVGKISDDPISPNIVIKPEKVLVTYS